MAINEVIYNGVSLIDLKNDTVTAQTLLSGRTAHDAGGNQIVGSLNPSGGGMTILDGSGNEMPAETYLQFTGGLSVTDDPVNSITIVSAANLVPLVLESTQTLSTTANTVFTFTNARITSLCGISVHTSIYRVNPYDVTVSGTTCTVIFAPYTSAVSLTCRIYVR